MPDPRHALGSTAELAVARWLTEAGWTIVARRLRPVGGGEIDIVAIDPAAVLVAIEVRARSTPRAGSPVESLDLRRVARLARSLGLAARGRSGHRGLRVDLVSVEPAGGAGRWRLRRLPGVEAGPARPIVSRRRAPRAR
jgi:putative endonuclease